MTKQSLSKDFKLLKFFNIILLLFFLLIGKEAIGAVPDGFVNELVASGMTAPVGLTFLPDGRILVIEQSGAIRLVVNGVLQPGSILDIQAQVSYDGAEQGLLGIAVDPGYPARPFIYLYYTHETFDYQYITRFTMTGTLTDPNGTDLTVDPNSYFYILTDIPRNSNMHIGGTLRFGIDSMLYAGPGDADGECVAQLRNDLKGVILRMDVSGLPLDNSVRDQATKAEMVPPDNPFVSAVDDNERLVWAYGLRNPFRFSIDSATGNLFIGDVGQDTYEEVSLSMPPGGENFGWPYREGYDTYSSTCYGDPEPVDETVEPIGGYYQLSGSNSVIGGVVYHAVNFPNDLSWPSEFDGDYFFADYFQGFLIRLKDQGDGTWAVPPPVSGQPTSEYFITELSSPSDFVMGPDGAIYYTSQWSNSVYRIGYIPTPYTLTVNKNGTGSGTVLSSDGGIDCGADCTEAYLAGTVVTLTAIPDAGSTFAGWTGGGCSGTGDCTVTMNATTTVTATFDVCSNPPVKITGRIPVYYSTLQAAYDAAVDGDIIQSQAARFIEDFNINRDISVTLGGGYDCSYTTNIGNTIINGNMAISDGTATIKNFRLKQ